MRLLSHNLLKCSVKKCNKNNYPLIIKVDKSRVTEVDINEEALKNLIPKLDWGALCMTVHAVNNAILKESLEEQIFLKRFLKN